jgi:hypothetical protein
MVWEYFSNRNWIDFSAGLDVIGDFFEQAPIQLPRGAQAVTAIFDLIHLNSAEASIPGGFAEPTGNAPFFLEVSRASAFTAINETNSGPFVGHDPRENPGLWDVTLYGSDASKLFWLADTDSVEELRDGFISAVTKLGDRYQRFDESRTGWTFDDSTFWLPTAFAVRATLWRAKIAVLLDEGDEAEKDFSKVYDTLASRFQ